MCFCFHYQPKECDDNMAINPDESTLSPLEESYKLIAPPENLTEEEKTTWEYFVGILKNGTRYRKTLADVELIRQFVQHKVMRDTA